MSEESVFNQKQTLAVEVLVTSLGDERDFCGLCALVIMARLAAEPGATAQSVASSVGDWLHNDYGPVAASAFDALARPGGEENGEGTRGECVPLILAEDSAYDGTDNSILH